MTNGPDLDKKILIGLGYAADACTSIDEDTAPEVLQLAQALLGCTSDLRTLAHELGLPNTIPPEALSSELPPAQFEQLKSERNTLDEMMSEIERREDEVALREREVTAQREYLEGESRRLAALQHSLDHRQTVVHGNGEANRNNNRAQDVLDEISPLLSDLKQKVDTADKGELRGIVTSAKRTLYTVVERINSFRNQQRAGE